MDRNTWIIIAIVVVVVIVGFFLLQGGGLVPTGAPAPEPTEDIPAAVGVDEAAGGAEGDVSADEASAE